MTHFFQRSTLILLATSALGVVATAAGAEGLHPNYAIRLAPQAAVQPAVLRDGDGSAGQLLLAAHRRHHRGAAAAGPAATYEVKSGDTLEKIAKTLGTTIPELKAANGLKKTALQPGQTLKNPNAQATAAAKGKKGKGRTGERVKADLETPPPEPTTYKVRHGDTLFSISKKLGVPVDELRAANGLSRRSGIHSGQVLKLSTPVAEEPAARPGRGRRSRSAEQASDTGAPGRVVTAEGPAVTYRVRKGDTLDKIARKLDTDVAQLRHDNRIKGAAVRPGRVLKGPRTSGKAYVAGAGDTLAGIAERFGVSTAALRAENRLSRRAGVRPGQKVRLPAGYRDHGRGAASDRSAPNEPPRIETPRYPAPRPERPRDENAPIRTQPDSEAPGLPSRPQPYNGTPTPPRVVGPPGTGALPTGAPPPSDAQIAAAGRGKFLWPIKGDILSDFGPKAGNQRNDGLNIQASAGEPVRAAADGQVVYAGDQVPGYGNLILVTHSDGWVTAYAYLSKVEVKMQQRVTQGQEIGLVGSTGGQPEPQLHFEIRYRPSQADRAVPIDPKLVLPK